MVTQFPKQLVTRGENKRVVNLYRKAAEGFEREADDAVRNYDSQLYYEDLHDAWLYFHDAGYAWQCVEEYEKSIFAYTRSIYYAQLVVRQFPDKHKDEYIAYSMNNLAYSYMMHGDTIKSLQTIDDAIRNNPGFMEYIDSKGELLYLCGRYQDALTIWDSIICVHPYFERNYWVDSCENRLRYEK